MTISNNSTLRLAIGNSLDSVFVWSIPLGGKRAYSDGTCPSKLDRTLTGEANSQFGTSLAIAEDGKTLAVGVPGSTQSPDATVLMVDIELPRPPPPPPPPGGGSILGNLLFNPKASSVTPLDNSYFVTNPSSVLVSPRRGSVGVPAPQPFDLNSWARGSPGGAPYNADLGYSISELLAKRGDAQAPLSSENAIWGASPCLLEGGARAANACRDTPPSRSKPRQGATPQPPPSAAWRCCGQRLLLTNASVAHAPCRPPKPVHIWGQTRAGEHDRRLALRPGRPGPVDRRPPARQPLGGLVLVSCPLSSLARCANAQLQSSSAPAGPLVVQALGLNFIPLSFLCIPCPLISIHLTSVYEM